MKDKKKWMMAAAAATGALIGRICYECRHFTTEYYDVASRSNCRKLLKASVLLCCRIFTTMTLIRATGSCLGR